VEQVVPSFISNSGNSRISVKGMLFDQFRFDDGMNEKQNGLARKDVTFSCRFVDSGTGSLIGTPRDM
jgi:hypothetical protein